MKKILFAILGLSLCLTLAGASLANEVAQGKCLGYDKNTNIVKVEEYDTNFSKEAPYGRSTGIVSDFNVTGAKIGIPPEAGDVLRIAFALDGTVKKATKVMNVSKQDLRKK